jgi:P pilus assembly chaperone PapD
MKARPYFSVGPRAGCIVRAAVIAAVLLAAAKVLSAQVDAVLHVRGHDAELRVGNPTAKPLHVSLTLFRDSTLTDSVPCRISPQSFTLLPGKEQVVRLRLRSTPDTTSRYRLGTLFTPVESPSQPAMRFVLATRIITRVEAGP